MAQDGTSFVEALEAENREALALLSPPKNCAAKAEGGLTVAKLLRAALKNEMEATEIASVWLPSVNEMDVKMGFARQVGDESRHYRLIEERLKALGDDLSGFDPAALPRTPLFEYLKALETSVERLAAGQLTREAIALVKNEQFIALCEASGDAETARLYRDTIQPDETFHQELGRKLTAKYATTPELQAKARAAARRTLELAEEMQGLALKKMGVHHAPGC